METINVKGELKEEKGTTISKSLRKSGKIPCVLYGGKENIHFTTTLNEVKNLIYGSKVFGVSLEVAGKAYSAILKETQFHPVTDEITHIDFQELVEDRMVKLDIPVEFTGTAKGVKEGGKQNTKLRTLKVKGLPQYLKESIEVDVTNLSLGQSVRVRDLNLEGLEIQNSPANPIVSVELTRVSRSVQTEGEAEGETAETGGEGEAAAEPEAKKEE